MSTIAPSHRIRSVSIIGGFLDGAKFDLADGLNWFVTHSMRCQGVRINRRSGNGSRRWWNGTSLAVVSK